MVEKGKTSRVAHCYFMLIGWLVVSVEANSVLGDSHITYSELDRLG